MDAIGVGGEVIQGCIVAHCLTTPINLTERCVFEKSHDAMSELWSHDGHMIQCMCRSYSVWSHDGSYGHMMRVMVT